MQVEIYHEELEMTFRKLVKGYGGGKKLAVCLMHLWMSWTIAWNFHFFLYYLAQWLDLMLLRPSLACTLLLLSS